MENIKTTYVKNNGTNNKSRIKRSKGTIINATAILKGEESEYENIVSFWVMLHYYCYLI